MLVCKCWLYIFLQRHIQFHDEAFVSGYPTPTLDPSASIASDCLPHRSVGRSMTNVPESIPGLTLADHMVRFTRLSACPSPRQRFLDPFPEISLALTDRGRFADVNQGLNYWCAVISWPFWGWFAVTEGGGGWLDLSGGQVENKFILYRSVRYNVSSF